MKLPWYMKIKDNTITFNKVWIYFMYAKIWLKLLIKK